MYHHHYHIDENYIEVQFIGKITMQELMTSVNEFDKEYSGCKEIRSLLDYTKCEFQLDFNLIALDLSDIKQSIIDRITKYDLVKHAVLITENDDNPMHELYKSLSKKIEKYHFEIFTDNAEARLWLQSQGN